MQIVPIPCLKDNYAYLVICNATNTAAIVDPSEAAPVVSAADRLGVRVSAIWNTHHHWDHVGGNSELRARFDVQVYGHISDKGRIPDQSQMLEDGGDLSLGELRVSIAHIPGHTMGAIAYVVKSSRGQSAVFTGDTLFLAGCGRLFEGTPADMHTSFNKLRTLDPTTLVYCGHEYTESNLRFAQYLEPSNEHIRRAQENAKERRSRGEATVPGTLGHELLVNPFFRTDSLELRTTLKLDKEADAVSVFAATRSAKDQF